MSSPAQLLFSVKAEGYAALTIETLIAQTSASGNQPGTLLPPPMPQPGLEVGDPGKTADDPLTWSDIVSRVFSKPWLTWFQSLYRFVTAGADPAGAPLQFLCPSVDETDSEWYATGSIDNITDPKQIDVTFVGQSRFGPTATVVLGGTGYSAATFTIESQDGSGRPATGTATVDTGSGKVVALPVTFNGYGLTLPLKVVITGDGTGATGKGNLGRQFSVGDFILWNDPAIVDQIFSYEIDQITAIEVTADTTAKFTLQRHAQGAATGIAQFGSPIRMHTDLAFYRLIPKAFQAGLNTTVGPQVLKFLWDNMTVAAVLATAAGIAPVLVNLAPLPFTPATTDPDPRNTPPAPGLRTMNGAAYTSLGITGVLSVGQTAPLRISVQAWESIRTVYCKVQTAPVGKTTFNSDVDACIVVYVVYRDPDGVTAALIDTLVIRQDDFNSYQPANVPDGRQMPYHGLWPALTPNYDWPPNRLPVLTSPFDANGSLQLPVVVDDSNTVVFHPDGQIDFIVGQVGTTTAGSDLVVTVQT